MYGMYPYVNPTKYITQTQNKRWVGAASDFNSMHKGVNVL